MVQSKFSMDNCQFLSVQFFFLSNDYDIPGWLLRVLIEYISKIKLRVRYQQNIGEEKDIPAGGGQGMWTFLFMIDKAGPKASSISIEKQITQPLNRRKKMKKTKKKWIDDFTLLASLDLKRSLVPDTEPLRPVPYRGRTGHLLPRAANILQDEIDSVVKLSKQRKMLLNPIKTKAMLLNPQRIYDFSPRLKAGDGQEIEVVEEHKILGNIIRSDMKTISNTEYICKRAYKKIWLLRRLNSMGCPVPELLDVLQQQVISICEGRF